MRSAAVIPSAKKLAMVVDVQPLDMIGFEEGVDDQLPIGRDGMGLALVEMVGGDAEGVEILAQILDLGEILGCVVRIPDQSAAFEVAEAASAHASPLSMPGKQSARGRPSRLPSER